MKLIFCKNCKDVVRLIETRWRKCECGKSGGQYNTDLNTATVGGECKVIGIPNPFFDEVFQYLREPDGKQWYREQKGYGYPNTSDLWYGEFIGDKQVFRIDSPDGERVKTVIEKAKGKDNPNKIPNLYVVKIVDDRKVTVAGEVLKEIFLETDFVPSFDAKAVIKELKPKKKIKK